MSVYSPLTEQLIESLQWLPGIGPKSASRMAFQLLAPLGREKAATMAQSIQSAIDKVQHCQQCRNYTEETLCGLCTNTKRNQTLLCVVEGPQDVVAIEQSHTYNGRYFVLHGHLSPLDGVGPAQLGLDLLKRLTEQLAPEELIVATNPTMEGEATAHYIATHVAGSIPCTRIAHGVPLGGELEYLDGGTLGHAFSARAALASVNEI